MVFTEHLVGTALIGTLAFCSAAMAAWLILFGTVKFCSFPVKERRAVNTFKSACILATCLLASGCYAPDDARFADEAASWQLSGSKLDESVARLRIEGFECDMKSSWPRVHCSRRKGSVLHACVESVTLTLDPSRGTVADVVANKAACSGL